MASDGHIDKREIDLIKSLCNQSPLFADYKFEDEIKHESKQIIENLMHKGFILEILTGDKEKATQKILDELEIKIKVKSDCTPLDKQNEIQSLKRQGKVIAMVGDGINDAPALAKADVGLAFSSHEQTAASDAADIVFLDGNFSVVLQSLNIAKRTLMIAKQSIFWGMGLSFLAMMFASFGAIPPIVGAGLQEVIDVAVILNSLRASKQ
jgi:P-type E1-E2 ATPase